MTPEEKHQVLATLSSAAIVRLKELPPPVVRVSGPLTSGGYGYDENVRRFIVAQEKLKAEGYTVFDYFEGNFDERQIVPLKLPWQEVMEYYHLPIMQTGLIATMFMMPLWEGSNGAKVEHDFAVKTGMTIKYIPEDWFES